VIRGERTPHQLYTLPGSLLRLGSCGPVLARVLADQSVWRAPGSPGAFSALLPLLFSIALHPPCADPAGSPYQVRWTTPGKLLSTLSTTYSISSSSRLRSAARNPPLLFSAKVENAFCSVRCWAWRRGLIRPVSALLAVLCVCLFVCGYAGRWTDCAVLWWCCGWCTGRLSGTPTCRCSLVHAR